MKVYIGPYISWIGPYQIAEKLLFWMDKDDDRVYRFGTWLAGEKDDSWLTKLCLRLETMRKRTVRVRIDKYDSWGADHTIALITLPILKQLQETKHGAPFVDDEDVPEEFRSTSCSPKRDEWDTDDNHFKRWDWVLGEMIHAFECKVEPDWSDKYWTGEWGKSHFKENETEVTNPLTNKTEKTYTLVGGGDRECDYDGLKKAQDRITNGFRLFGKYYEGLWD